MNHISIFIIGINSNPGGVLKRQIKASERPQTPLEEDAATPRKVSVNIHHTLLQLDIRRVVGQRAAGVIHVHAFMHTHTHSSGRADTSSPGRVFLLQKSHASSISDLCLGLEQD